jgi:hypothetical protein
MPNSHIFTGLDGSISVAVEAGPEGDAAKGIADTYQLTPIGRASGVSVKVHSDIRPYHEVGQRYATELRAGNVNITGTISRAVRHHAAHQYPLPTIILAAHTILDRDFLCF